MKALQHFDRPVFINHYCQRSVVSACRLNFLSEEIWVPFFDAHHLNRVQGFEHWKGHNIVINCNNCKNYWLKKNPQYLERISDIYCDDSGAYGGKNISDSTTFKDC